MKNIQEKQDALLSVMLSQKKIKGYENIFLIDDKHDNITATNQIIPHCAHHLSEILE